MSNSKRAILAASLKRTILLFFIVLLIGIAQPCNAGIFFDYFDDGNADGWVFPFYPTNSQGPGSWSVESGMLVQNAANDHHQGLVDNLLISNQVVEVQVFTGGYGGVVLWSQNAERWISVTVYPLWTGIVINEVIDGSWFTLPYEYRTSDRWYNLKVDADSATGELAIYLDDTYIFTYFSTTPYRSGSSGVISGNTVGYFDNFSVTSDDILTELILFEDFEDSSGFTIGGGGGYYWGIADLSGYGLAPSNFVQGGGQSGMIFFGSDVKEYQGSPAATMTITLPDLTGYTDLQLYVALAAPDGTRWENTHRDSLHIIGGTTISAPDVPCNINPGCLPVTGAIDSFLPNDSASPLWSQAYPSTYLQYTFQDYVYAIDSTMKSLTFAFASTDYDEVVGIDSVRITGIPLVHLNATKEGTGSGGLSALNLTCNGNICSGTYSRGTTITITATANTGSHFDSWLGCDSTESNLCIVTMKGNKSVSATFTLNNYTLTVTKTGSGSGMISASGLSCIGTTCTGSYPYNTPVTITAIPDSTSNFTEWTGCDSTNSNTCTVTMTGNRSVSAVFTRMTHDLTVGKIRHGHRHCHGTWH